MKAHVDHAHHIAVAQGIPGIEDIVVAHGNVIAVGQQLLHPGYAAAARVTVKSSL